MDSGKEASSAIYRSDLDMSNEINTQGVGVNNYYNHPTYVVMERNNYSDQRLNQNLSEPTGNEQYSGSGVATSSGDQTYTANQHLLGQYGSQHQGEQQQLPVEQHFIYHFGGSITVKANANQEVDLGSTNIYIREAVNQFLGKIGQVEYNTAANNLPEVMIVNKPLKNTTLQVEIQGSLTTPNNSNIDIRDIQSDLRISKEQKKVLTKAEQKDYPQKRKSTRKLLNRLRHHNTSPVGNNKNEGPQTILEEAATLHNSNNPR